MTFPLLIAKLESIRPGQIKEEAVCSWCNKLDTKIFKELILTHEHSQGVRMPHYDRTDLTADTPLLAESGYDDVYIWWCCMEIDMQYGDLNRYSVSRSMFNDAYADMAARYTRTHMPLSVQTDEEKRVHHVLGGLL